MHISQSAMIATYENDPIFFDRAHFYLKGGYITKNCPKCHKELIKPREKLLYRGHNMYPKARRVLVIDITYL
jgi:hypothetical protein